VYTQEAEAFLEGEKAPRWKLEPSESYMVIEEQPERAFEIFEEHLLYGWRGLCITRQHPKQLCKRYNIENAQVFWLTELKEENTVKDLLEISLLIGKFVESTKSGIVLLDGLEYLASRYDFDAVYQFIQNKRSQVAKAEAILLVPVHPKTFPEEKRALLERELKSLLQCFENAISQMLGEGVKKALLERLEKDTGLKRDELIGHTDVLTRNLKEIFGGSALVLERMIMKQIYTELGLDIPPQDLDIRKPIVKWTPIERNKPT